jgi:hypothetical protein
MAWLKGKKTYIIVVLLALVQLVEFVSAGVFTAGSFVSFLETEGMIALGATIRAGIGNK